MRRPAPAGRRTKPNPPHLSMRRVVFKAHGCASGRRTVPLFVGLFPTMVAGCFPGVVSAQPSYCPRWYRRADRDAWPKESVAIRVRKRSVLCSALCSVLCLARERRPPESATGSVSSSLASFPGSVSLRAFLRVHPKLGPERRQRLCARLHSETSAAFYFVEKRYPVLESQIENRVPPSAVDC